MGDFDKMSFEEIHAIKRLNENKNIICKKICEYICNTNRLSIEEVVGELLKEENIYHNPYASLRLSEFYRDGLFFPQSDEIYISKLEQFCAVLEDYLIYAKDLFNENYDCPLIAWLSPNEWTAIADIGEVSDRIGLYYMGSSDIQHLQKAQYYFSVALWCHFDVSEKLDNIEKKIKRLHNRNNDNCFSETIMHYQPTDHPDTLFFECKRQLSESFGDIWNKLSKQTKAHLTTALFTYSQYLQCKQIPQAELDYSGVTSLVMRALEYELNLFFYQGYIHFLNNHYQYPTQYMSRNGIAKWEYRKSIITQTDICKLQYVLPEEVHFSLGKLSFIIGYRKRFFNGKEDIKLDDTFFEYCKSETDFSNDVSIKTWVKRIVESVEILRKNRNDASHGGNVMSLIDAQNAFDIIVWVKKILFIIVTHIK